jgi:hypothetical protein
VIWRASVRVFLLFTGIYLLTWGGHYTSGDGSYKVAWAKAIFLDHSAVIDMGHGPTVSKYGVGHSLLAIPPLALARMLLIYTGIHCEGALYTLLFIVNGALFLGLLYFYLAHFYPPGQVLWTVGAIGLASTWWPYTKLDFSEPLILTIVFLGFVLLRFGHPTAGLLIAAFALTVRLDALLVLAPLILWHLNRNRSVQAAARVALALAPSIALILVANYARFHSIADKSYADEHFSNPLLVGLYGILFSAGKSIFLFSPPLLLGVWGWKRFSRRPGMRSDAWFFLAVAVAQILLYAKWWDWSSDDAWGVRFVVPSVVLMCIPIVEMVHRRALIATVIAAGVCVQLLAVSVSGLEYLLLMRSQSAHRQALYVDGLNRVDFEDIRFNPAYSQLAGHWLLVRHLLHIPPSPGPLQETQTVGTRLYDTLPRGVWADAANWDFIWHPRRSSPVAGP